MSDKDEDAGGEIELTEELEHHRDHLKFAPTSYGQTYSQVPLFIRYAWAY